MALSLKIATKSKSLRQVDDKCLVLKVARSSQGIVRRRGVGERGGEGDANGGGRSEENTTRARVGKGREGDENYQV